MIVPLCAMVVCALAGEKPPRKSKTYPIKAASLNLEGSIQFPDNWVEDIALSKGAPEIRDPEGQKQIEKDRALPNADFEKGFGWSNTGERLVLVRLELGAKRFRGTTKQLAKRSVQEIRAKWAAFKKAKPSYRTLELLSGPALYVALENPKEPPYRVHFVTLVVEGSGCGLYCYGWGPQVNIVNLSGGQGVPDDIKRLAEEKRRLSPKQLKTQKRLFQEFAKAIAPTLKLRKVVPAKPNGGQRKPKG